MTQREPALRCGVTEVYISTICSGKKKITASMANKLEYVLGFPAVAAITDPRPDFFRLLKHIANGDLDHTALLIDNDRINDDADKKADQFAAQFA